MVSRQLTHPLLLMSQSYFWRARYEEIWLDTVSTHSGLPAPFKCPLSTAPKATNVAIRPQLVVPSLNVLSATSVTKDILSSRWSRSSLLTIPAETSERMRQLYIDILWKGMGVFLQHEGNVNRWRFLFLQKVKRCIKSVVSKKRPKYSPLFDIHLQQCKIERK